ncbi:MAG: GFA family protein [Gammaproteobacteria bacterium]
MRTYRGSCHCKAVQFEITTGLTQAIACNCSICSKKGALHHRVSPQQFKLLTGEDALALYQFGTKTAKHWFCKHCGIHPFSNPRLAPEQYSINICCLDDFDIASSTVQMQAFDGKNWEEAAITLR